MGLATYQFTGASPEFVCTCTLVVQGQSFSGKGTTAQKKKAKHIAAKATLMQLQRWFQYGERVEIEKPETSVACSAEASASVSHQILRKQLKDGQNFIDFLRQLCQTLIWDLPEYEFMGETPEFICTCTVWTEGQCFSGKAISSQKKKAKYFAAKVVLLDLQQYFQGNSEIVDVQTNGRTLVESGIGREIR